MANNLYNLKKSDTVTKKNLDHVRSQKENGKDLGIERTVLVINVAHKFERNHGVMMGGYGTQYLEIKKFKLRASFASNKLFIKF